MRYEPIIEPKIVGSRRSTPTLSRSTMLDTGFGDAVLKIEFNAIPETIEIKYIGGLDWENFPTVRDWEQKYSDLIAKGDVVTIFFNTPLYDELYELNKTDHTWYLVKQGRGFA